MGGELKNRSRLSITLPNEVDARIRAVANREGRTVSDVIEELILKSLGDVEVVSEVRRDPFLDKLVTELMSSKNIARARRMVGEGDIPDSRLKQLLRKERD